MHRLDLARDEQAPIAARRALADWPLDVDADTASDALLLISELVTNSVVHGRGERITLILDSEEPGRFRVDVIDDGVGFVPTGREGRDTGGWGLELVEQLSRSWGVREGSTQVWFELASQPDAWS